MTIITIYAIVRGKYIVSTTHDPIKAKETCDILNQVNSTDDYIVVPCNGVLI